MVTPLFLGKYSKGASILLIYEDERGKLIIQVFKGREIFIRLFFLVLNLGNFDLFSQYGQVWCSLVMYIKAGPGEKSSEVGSANSQPM